ncbi:MAG: hypothetical protein M1822_009458 [Bathelium mastoideum]|nr:MAG: hypothetical protein M1822_009458 [Bathelium mastoideum]
MAIASFAVFSAALPTLPTSEGIDALSRRFPEDLKNDHVRAAIPRAASMSNDNIEQRNEEKIKEREIFVGNVLQANDEEYEEYEDTHNH